MSERERMRSYTWSYEYKTNSGNKFRLRENNSARSKLLSFTRENENPLSFNKTSRTHHCLPNKLYSTNSTRIYLYTPSLRCANSYILYYPLRKIPLLIFRENNSHRVTSLFSPAAQRDWESGTDKIKFYTSPRAHQERPPAPTEPRGARARKRQPCHVFINSVCRCMRVYRDPDVMQRRSSGTKRFTNAGEAPRARARVCTLYTRRGVERGTEFARERGSSAKKAMHEVYILSAYKETSRYRSLSVRSFV